MRIPRKPAIAVLAFAGLLLFAGIFFGLRHIKGEGKPREMVTLAVTKQPVSALLYIAQAKGYFRSEGLEVMMQPYSSGKAAFDAVLGGNAQLATVAETPIMFAGLDGRPVCVVATIADSDRYVEILARKDSGISKPGDLRYKKVGVTAGTNGEFFLEIYLLFYRIPKNEVHIINMDSGEMVSALIRRKIDAVATWEPYLTILQRKLGNNAVLLINEDIYRAVWNIAAEKTFVDENPDIIKRLLSALLRARYALEAHPGEAQRITDKYIGLSGASFSGINFDVRMSQTLLVILDDQARWAIRNHYTRKTEVPNYLNLLYTKGLEAVDPYAVTVIHE